MSKTNITIGDLISLCHLELDLMIDNAKLKYATDIESTKDDGTREFEAIDIGLDLGNRYVRLSGTALEMLDRIKALDRNTYSAFVYAYNGAISIIRETD